MDGKINADLKSLKFIFDRYKPYILPSIIILACIVLFLQFVIPQFKNLFTAQEEARQTSLKLQTLKENLNIFTNTDDKFLNEGFRIVNLALPLNKDFNAILNAIHYASDNSGVILGNFSLQIGDLQGTSESDDFPSISVSIPINADAARVNGFVEILSKTVPLSEVTAIKITNTVSTVKASFYYKPLDLSNLKEDARINPLTQKALDTINKVGGFKNISP